MNVNGEQEAHGNDSRDPVAAVSCGCGQPKIPKECKGQIRSPEPHLKAFRDIRDFTQMGIRCFFHTALVHPVVHSVEK